MLILDHCRTGCHAEACRRIGFGGKDKEPRSGGVLLEMPVRYPVQVVDRLLDTEMRDSYQRYLFGSFQNINDL